MNGHLRDVHKGYVVLTNSQMGIHSGMNGGQKWAMMGIKIGDVGGSIKR